MYLNYEIPRNDVSDEPHALAVITLTYLTSSTETAFQYHETMCVLSSLLR